MRIYKPADEENLRLLRLAVSWRRSAMLTENQFRKIESSVRTDLKRTTIMLRILLFIFTVFLIAATVAFVGWLGQLNEASGAGLCAIAAALSYWAAEDLADRRRFYRHGVEEAFAIGALVLAMISVGYFLNSGTAIRGEALSAVMEGLAGIGAFILFARFGFLYMSLGGILALACIPFTVLDGVIIQRVFLTLLLLMGFFLIRLEDRVEAPVFRREENGVLFACLFLGLCLAVNLRLGDLRPWEHHHVLTAPAGTSPTVYWVSYFLTFLIPLAGIAAGIYARRRALIIASAAGIILALCTNKDYLGFRHYAWDPAVLGVLLIGVSVLLERKLKEEKNGYTAKELLIPGSHGLEAAALAAGSAGISPAADVSVEGGAPFGGGSSGGAGSSRSF